MNDIQYTTELLGIFKSIPDDKKSDFNTRYTAQTKNVTVIFGSSIFLGSLGVDRFFLGQIGLGILKILTLGGFGIWTVVDWFIIGGITRKMNIEMARKITSTL